jgi:hypothetical protein
MPESQRRTVNRSLGTQAKIGPFPANQILPITTLFWLVWLASSVLALDWVESALLGIWLLGSWWVLAGNRPGLFIVKFTRCPNYARSRIIYRSLFNHAPTQRKDRSKNPSRR